MKPPGPTPKGLRRGRLRKGGHAVPVADIRRRFRRSLEHLVTDYLPLADDWQVCDNSGSRARVLATSRNHAIEAVKQLIQS